MGDLFRKFLGLLSKKQVEALNSDKMPEEKPEIVEEELPDDLKPFEAVKKYQQKLKLTVKTKQDKFYVETKFNNKKGFYTNYKEWYEYSETEEAKAKPYGNLSLYEFIYIEFFDQVYDKENEFICINYSNGASMTFRRKDLLSFSVEETT